MGEGKREARDGGLFPVIRSLLGHTKVDIDNLCPSQIDLALQSGLGPVLAHIAAPGHVVDSRVQAAIRAADLTARLLTAEKLDVLLEVLDAAQAAGCRPLLLKGISAALRYYPEPHMRTMGDIDLLVAFDQQRKFEDELRRRKFYQASHEPPAAFVGRHHSMPFWHREHPVCVEVHVKLHPRQYILASDPRFTFDAMESHLSPMMIQGRSATTMNHELHLVYTITRWAERLEYQRGVFPMLDVGQLLRDYGNIIDWSCVRRLVERSWAITALNLMLSFLSKYELVPVPSDVLQWLVRNDHYTNALSMGALHRLLWRYVILRKPFSDVLGTQNNMETIWSVLVRPSTPTRNLLRIPYSLAGSAYRTYVQRVREGGRSWRGW
jgi:putative nucleotidyltransferase-like protein